MGVYVQTNQIAMQVYILCQSCSDIIFIVATGITISCRLCRQYEPMGSQVILVPRCTTIIFAVAPDITISYSLVSWYNQKPVLLILILLCHPLYAAQPVTNFNCLWSQNTSNHCTRALTFFSLLNYYKFIIIDIVKKTENQEKQISHLTLV